VPAKTKKQTVPLEGAAKLLAAFADPTRLRLLSLIQQNGEICVCDLMEITDLPQTKISKHLAVLRNADLVGHRREGTWMHYSMMPPATELHASLLRSLAAAPESVPELAQDLRRLKLTDCCSPTSKPIQIRLSKRY